MSNDLIISPFADDDEQNRYAGCRFVRGIAAERCLVDRRLTDSARRVLGVILTCMNSERQRSWPSWQFIMMVTGIKDEDTVSKAIKLLKETGYIFTEKRQLEKGQRALTLYGLRGMDLNESDALLTELIVAYREKLTPRLVRGSEVVSPPVQTGGQVGSPPIQTGGQLSSSPPIQTGGQGVSPPVQTGGQGADPRFGKGQEPKSKTTNVFKEERLEMATTPSNSLFGDEPDQDHRIEGIEVPEHLADAIEQALREPNGRSLVKSLRATVRKQSRAGFADQDIRDAMSMGASVEIEEASEAGRVAKPAAIIGRARRYVEQVRITEERRTSSKARGEAPASPPSMAGSGFTPANGFLE